MNVLIVFAHPEPNSFSAALKNTAVQTLTELDHQVTVSDLYQMGWSPTLGAAEEKPVASRKFPISSCAPTTPLWSSRFIS